MYNRYIRNDHGDYERIPLEEEAPTQATSPPKPVHDSFHRTDTASGGNSTPFDGPLRSLLDQLHLNHIDAGDLLLLGLLFFLFREGADEELLIALGLLLIL